MAADDEGEGARGSREADEPAEGLPAGGDCDAEAGLEPRLIEGRQPPLAEQMAEEMELGEEWRRRPRPRGGG